jgi:uncharacterized Fe-S center protein
MIFFAESFIKWLNIREALRTTRSASFFTGYAEEIGLGSRGYELIEI